MDSVQNQNDKANHHLFSKTYLDLFIDKTSDKFIQLETQVDKFIENFNKYHLNISK